LTVNLIYNRLMYSIYVIYNAVPRRFYIGQTCNLENRLTEHNRKVFKGYTARFPGKWVLIYEESVATRPEALRREKQLKSFRGREFIKKFIPG
jgi:putative endonuclease